MKITQQQYEELVTQRQVETINDGKDLLRWSLIWWLIFVMSSLLSFFNFGFGLLTLSVFIISLFLVRIGNMLCEISTNIRITIRQNDDIRALLLPKPPQD